MKFFIWSIIGISLLSITLVCLDQEINSLFQILPLDDTIYNAVLYKEF